MPPTDLAAQPLSVMLAARSQSWAAVTHPFEWWAPDGGAIAARGATPTVPRADAARLAIAGHSMGGHGAWALAALAPARALGVAVGAGWAAKERYGHANTSLVVVKRRAYYH